MKTRAQVRVVGRIQALTAAGRKGGFDIFFLVAHPLGWVTGFGCSCRSAFRVLSAAKDEKPDIVLMVTLSLLKTVSFRQNWSGMHR